MGNLGERAKGKAEEVGGAIKGAVGKAIGNEQMQAEGKLKELKGTARQTAAKAAERLKGTGQEIAGGLKKAVGKVLRNEQMQLEGKAKQLEGHARKATNK